MELILVVLIGAAVVSWGRNFYLSGQAKNGVRFDVPHPPAAVVAAIASAYLGSGLGAKAKSFIRGVEVRAAGPTGFTYGTKYGDQGRIEVVPGPHGSVVRATTSRLFVGWNRNPSANSGFYQLVFGLTSLLMKVVYFRPNGPRMNRFQSGLERRVQKGRT